MNDYDKEVKVQGVCTNYEWCDYKIFEKGEYSCIAEFDGCDYLEKKD